MDYSLLCTHFQQQPIAAGLQKLRKDYSKKAMVESPFLMNCRLETCNFIKKEVLAQVFSREYYEIFKNIFLQKNLKETTSAKLLKKTKIFILLSVWHPAAEVSQIPSYYLNIFLVEAWSSSKMLLSEFVVCAWSFSHFSMLSFPESANSNSCENSLHIQHSELGMT